MMTTNQTPNTTPDPLSQMRAEHVMISTDDYQQTLNWYQSKLGFAIQHEWTVPEFPGTQLAFILKPPLYTCFRAVTALSVQGALEKECRLPFKQVQHSNGSAVKLPKGGAKKDLFCVKLYRRESNHAFSNLPCLNPFILPLKTRILRWFEYRKNGFIIEVVSTPESYQQKRIPEDLGTALGDRGFGHLAFLVADVDTVADALHNKGIDLVVPPTSFPDAGRRLIFIKDNNGNFLEFLTPLSAYE